MLAGIPDAVFSAESESEVVRWLQRDVERPDLDDLWQLLALGDYELRLGHACHVVAAA